MDEHTLTQMMEGVSNKGLPPGCYINKSGVAEKQRRRRLERIERRLTAIEQRLKSLEDIINDEESGTNAVQ